LAARSILNRLHNGPFVMSVPSAKVGGVNVHIRRVPSRMAERTAIR
jgi:hypothetical protein